MSSLSNVQTASTTNTASSSVRPRATRLISVLDNHGDDIDPPPIPTPNTAGTPYDSRSASPIPSAHPQRSSSNQPASSSTSKFIGSSWGRRAQLAAQKYVPAESPSLAGMWGTSWSTLQGLASEFLGNEEEPVKEGQKKKRAPPFASWYAPRTESPSAGQQREWGPPRASSPATNHIGTGTKQEREAALRAQKRKDMLLRQDSSYADALGRFKRRLSDDYESTSVPPSMGKDDDDGAAAALVYVHQVAKDDTMAGITIKYNCSVNILRKANRMWANDTPQTRQTLVIPVAACGVKGKPVPEPASVDLLTPELDKGEDPPTPKPTLSNGDSNTNSRTRTSSLSTDAATSDNNPPWHHDSWVLLPSFTQPTQIARLSRRTLGYFPPARRKSASFDDGSGNDNNHDEGAATPPGSLDIPRNNDTTTSRSPQRPRRQHQRRLSNASNGYYPSYLSGPGGVGTMNKNVRAPGPAQDGLNKMFAKHLPDVAPPKNQIDLYHPDIPLYADEITPSASGTATPSGNGAGKAGNINLENVGGAIEGWVRKMAARAVTPSEGQAKARAARASVGTPGKGGGGIGDLIEMTDEFEIGVESESEVEMEVERGRQSRGRNSGGDYFGPMAGVGAGGTGGSRKVEGVRGGELGRSGTVVKSGKRPEAVVRSQSGWKGGKGD